MFLIYEMEEIRIATKLECIEYVSVEQYGGKYMVKIFTDKASVMVGEYTTEERAKEVFESILDTMSHEETERELTKL